MAATSNVVTDEEIEVIIGRVAGGMTLLQSCKKSKRDYININKRINASQQLKQFYAHTREEYGRTRVQQMDDIARDKSIDPQRARLMCDNIKWEAARVLPKEYGDRVQQEVIITNNTTLSQRMKASRTRVERQVATALPPRMEGGDVEP